MSDWQPIETAPKTGEFVWLSDGDFMRLGFWGLGHWVDLIRDAQARVSEIGGTRGITFTPRYWQKLPSLPRTYA